MERHVKECPACQSELEALGQLTTQLTRNLPTQAALPEALRSRILASLPESAKPRPVLLPFWRRPGSLAAFGGVLAMGCAALLWLRVPPDQERISQERISPASSATKAAAPGSSNPTYLRQ